MHGVLAIKCGCSSAHPTTPNTRLTLTCRLMMANFSAAIQATASHMCSRVLKCFHGWLFSGFIFRRIILPAFAFPIFDQSYTYTTAINNLTAPKLDVTVFPNPASEQIQIFANMQGEHEVDITDITGRAITSGKFDDNIIINTSSYGKGIYLASISDVNNPGERVTKKFIVQ